MKELPTIIAARSGDIALELCQFDGTERVPNRDAVGFYYMVRLAPTGEPRRLGVIFSGTVLHIEAKAFALPDYGDRTLNFKTFAAAAIGDHLDDSGLPTYATDLHVPQIECFSPHFQAWTEGDPATDEEIESYLTSHLYWSWKYSHDAWTVGAPDQLRLRSDLRNTARIVQLGEGEDWEVLNRADDAIILKPTTRLLRRMRQGPQQLTSHTDRSQEGTQVAAEQIPEHPGYPYVDEVRIADLKRLEQKTYDLRKLVALCEELNICSRSQCHHAVAALTRVLLDHVPPVFGVESFTEVTNNYAGSKSFKECMQRLDGTARKIADGHLHTQIRKAESLPTRTQVNFSNEIDMLLAEVVRILS